MFPTSNPPFRTYARLREGVRPHSLAHITRPCIIVPSPTRHLIYGPVSRRREGVTGGHIPASHFAVFRSSTPPLHTLRRGYMIAEPGTYTSTCGRKKKKPVYSIVSRTPVFYITRAPSHCRSSPERNVAGWDAGAGESPTRCPPCRLTRPSSQAVFYLF